jgi:hypothetical protein
MARAAARPRPADAVLPALNTLIRLTIGTRSSDPDAEPLVANVPSRIEDVEPADPQAKGGRTQLFVAVPHYAGDVDVPRPGTACTVTWVSPGGLYDLPTGFVERVVVGPVVRAWRVEVTGPAVRAQRRRYVRVPWTKPVVVEVLPVVRLPHTNPVDAEEAGDPGSEPAERETVHGNTLDLSEGGIRCTLPPPPLRDGQPVRVQLDVEGNSLVLDGTVVRVKVTTAKPGGRPHCETGIAFTEPDEYGDLLRKVIFSEQLRSRRSGIA